jgi:hypothetical protein
MRLRCLLLGVLTAMPIAALVSSCETGGVTAIGLVMKAPQGLLQDASAVRLSIFDATGAQCGSDGHVDIPVGEGTQTFDLANTGCAAGAAWCKDIELDQDGSTKMFAVVASSAAGILAEGCTTAAINQDPLEVTIKVQRFVPPKCCNDGMLQPGEQCDVGVAAPTDCVGSPGGQCLGVVADDVCECDCVAKEIPVDRTVTEIPATLGQRTQLAMAFCPGDEKIPNALRATFRNTDGASNASDVNLRVLLRDLYPVPVEVSDPLSHPLRLPLLCTSVEGMGAVREQLTPAIAPVSDAATAVVYASNQDTPSRFDIVLSSQSILGCADDPPVTLNTTLENSISSDPDVAGGPPGSALAVWTRDNQIFGRIWSTTGELKPPTERQLALSGSKARVAGNESGWVVVYQGTSPGDSDGIFIKIVNPNGDPGPELQVNIDPAGLQDQPDVAMLGEQIIVVWRSGGDIYFQRYRGLQEPVPGDQESPIHAARDGEQSNPAVASAPGASEFFTVVWEEIGRGDIGARFVGAEAGFGFNSVTGQNDDFLAGQPGRTGVRRFPAVAMGGGGFVAIGWQDDDPGHTGIFVRRFPLPQ